jgi:hypothetical protein
LSSVANDRLEFARVVAGRQSIDFAATDAKRRLREWLAAGTSRVIAEYGRQADLVRKGAVSDVSRSTLFQDRGLSSDTSIYPGFGVEQALAVLLTNRLLSAGSVRRVGVVGPGLDFVDKRQGADFYPVQTIQPFTTIDSLVRVGLVSRPDEIQLMAFDLSPRVIDHIRTIRDRARGGTPYPLRVPAELASQWTPALLSYWKSVGDRIGSDTPAPQPPGAVQGVEVRGIEVRPQVAALVAPVEFNIVTGKWTGQPFDLVVATNVLVYYDRLDQALAFAAVESMLRPGGFFITNNVVVELPLSRLRAVGLMTVRYSPEKIDQVFWYRRNS